MASAGDFPKVDGDVYYGQDANMTYYNATLTGTMNYGNISVTTAATLIKATNASRKSILVRNYGSASLFIGGNNSVTTGNGFEVQANQSIYIKDTDEIYGIVASGTLDVRYLETQ
jgi:hypothetical protein